MFCITRFSSSTPMTFQRIFTLRVPSTAFLYFLHISSSPTSYCSVLFILLLTSFATILHLMFVYAMFSFTSITSLLNLKYFLMISSMGKLFTQKSSYNCLIISLPFPPSGVSLPPTLLQTFRKMLCLKITSMQLSAYVSWHWVLVRSWIGGSCFCSPCSHDDFFWVVQCELSHFV